MEQIERGDEMLSFVWGLPRPTYLVSSGTGIHIYYVFEKPIPLFKNIVEQLEVLKKRLTWQAWTQGASSLHDNVQYESLFQGFRMVGTITKRGKGAGLSRSVTRLLSIISMALFLMIIGSKALRISQSLRFRLLRRNILSGIRAV